MGIVCERSPPRQLLLKCFHREQARQRVFEIGPHMVGQLFLYNACSICWRSALHLRKSVKPDWIFKKQRVSKSIGELLSQTANRAVCIRDWPPNCWPTFSLQRLLKL